MVVQMGEALAVNLCKYLQSNTSSVTFFLHKFPGKKIGAIS